MARSTYNGAGARYFETVTEAADAVGRRATEHVAGEAQRRAPVRTGELRASATVDHDSSGERYVGTIVFDTPYAAAQHEGVQYYDQALISVKRHRRRLKTPYEDEDGVLVTHTRVRAHTRTPPSAPVVFRNHPKGGGPKYLEDPIIDLAGQLDDLVADAVDEAVRREFGR